MTDLEDRNLALVEDYYKCVLAKDLDAAGRHLHPDIEFISPLGAANGKQEVLKALEGFAQALKGLTQRGQFSKGDSVVLIYDAEFGGAIDSLRTAVMLTIQDDLIKRTELFHDASPFKEKGKASML